MRFAQLRVVPHAAEIGVGLEDVEVGVHGFFLVGLLVAQAHVVDGVPFARAGFEVAAGFVVAVFFYQVEEVFG